MEQPASTTELHRCRASGRRRMVALTLVAAALGLAACSSSGNSASTTTTTTASTGSATATTSAASPQAVVKTMSVSGLGAILVNSQGQVLYTFTNNGKAVACSSACLAAWPPVTLPAGVSTPTGPSGVGTFGTTHTNGVTQVTLNGLPLFTYAGDSGPGVANGNDITSFGGIWKVVKAS
jgi:predicted lipoprotein with Yx(FWY)xxD motif